MVLSFLEQPLALSQLSAHVQGWASPVASISLHLMQDMRASHPLPTPHLRPSCPASFPSMGTHLLFPFPTLP